MKFREWKKYKMTLKN